LFCKFKYLFSKIQEKNVKISVFSKKNAKKGDFGVFLGENREGCARFWGECGIND
jgi:hypothetical protein